LTRRSFDKLRCNIGSTFDNIFISIPAPETNKDHSRPAIQLINFSFAFSFEIFKL